jgi:hypothetical protein
MIGIALILMYPNLTIILEQTETNFSLIMVKFYRFLSETRSVLFLCFSFISIGFLSIKKMNFFMLGLKGFELDLLEKIWDYWDSFKITNKINTNALKRLIKNYPYKE